MKKLLLLKTAVLLVFTLSFKASSAMTPPPATYAELIIQIPNVDVNRALPQLKSDILALGGIQIVSYCNKFKCLLLKVDRGTHPDDHSVFDLLISKNISFEVKIESTIAQVTSQCNIDGPPVTGAK